MLIRLLTQLEEFGRVEEKLFFNLHSFTLTSIKGSVYLYAIFAHAIGKNKKSYLKKIAFWVNIEIESFKVQAKF